MVDKKVRMKMNEKKNAVEIRRKYEHIANALVWK